MAVLHADLYHLGLLEMQMLLALQRVLHDLLIATAVGLGFGDVVVTELLKARLGADAAKEPRGVAVGFMFPEQRDAALALASRLRREGERVDLSLRSLKPKKFFAHASERGAAKAVFLGPDDLARGVARMKDMETREETEVCLS